MRRRGLAQNSALALAGDVSTKIAMFLLMIVAARHLSISKFALLASALATATVLTAGLDLGSQTLLTRDGVDGPATRGSLLRSLAIARLPVVCVSLAAAAVIGASSGRLVLALLTAMLAIAGAAQLSLSGALRSAQDLRPEAFSKALVGVCTLAGGAICVLLLHDATSVVGALTIAMLVGSVPMLWASRRVILRGPRASAWAPVRRALPLGMMALATLVYYRSGTIALSITSSPRQTAAFAAASMIAFGVLAFANAVTTGLLPRLAAAADGADRAAVTRRALRWTMVLAVLLGGAIAATSRDLITILYGPSYRAAAGPLAILALSTILIAFTGVLGTALIASGRVRPVATQVGASLVVNVLALAILSRPLGAEGAALATVVCESVALVMLVRVSVREMPGVIAPRLRRSPPFRRAGRGAPGPRSSPTGPAAPARQ
jgi:O-antigen/teichoic acid export membrane protein